jgi:hypothetical protein
MNKLLGRLETLDECYSFYEDYAEPGYSLQEHEAGILAANWNDVPRELYEQLEQYYAMEWCDEWDRCTDCNKAVRCSPDSYGWQASYHIIEGDSVCGECIKKDPDEYIESLINNPDKCDTLGLDLEEHGFQLLETNEAGLHEHQFSAEPPLDMYIRGRKTWLEIVFQLDESRQFDMSYSMYGR